MRGGNDTLEYVFRRKSYTFNIEGVVHEQSTQNAQDTPCKRIYSGYFDNPPEGLEPHVKYALLWIYLDEAHGNAAQKIPGNREYREVVQYTGDHIRQILHRNDNAIENEERILRGATPRNTVCMVVEPLYEEIPRDLSCLTDYERLLMLEQMCCSIIELQDPQDPLYKVIAHRDIKLSNYVLEREKASFRLRLIDMASMRTSVDGGGTYRGGVLLSPQSTSPEGLLAGWTINEKTDVYALGGVFGEVFGNCNPLSSWVLQFWPNDHTEVGMCADRLKDALQRMIGRYGYDTDRWLEQEVTDFKWVFRDCPEEIQDRLKTIFEKMTKIDPQYRPDVKSVHQELREILAWMENTGRDSRSGFGLKEKTVNSVYLFDTVNLRGNMSNYEAACNRAWRQETLRAKRNGETVRSYIGFYGRVNPPAEGGGRLSPNKRKEHVDIGRSQYDYDAMICAVKSWADEKELGMNLLGYVMGAAREIISLPGEKVNYIHIFMPAMPQDKDIMLFRGKNVQEIYNEMKRTRPSVKIIVHSYTQPEDHTDDKKWYDQWNGLTGKAYHFGDFDEFVPEETDDYVPPDKIVHGTGGLYLKANGKNIYVGIERK